MTPTKNKLLVFASGSGAGSFGDKIIEPYYPMFIASLSTSPVEIGVLNSVASLAGVSAQLVFGVAGDSIGRRKPFVVLGYLFKAIFYILIARAAAIKQLIFLQSGQAFLFGMVTPNSNALLAEVVEPSRRSRTAAALTTIASLAAIPAILLGGLLIANYGIRSIFLPAALFLSTASFLFILIDEPKQEKRKINILTRDVVEELRRNRSLFYFLAGSIVWAFGVHMVSPLIPPLILVNKLGFAQSEFASLSIISIVTALTLTVPLGIMAEKRGTKNFIVFAYAIGTAIIIGYVYAANIAQVAVLVFLAALAGAASAGPLFSMLSGLTPRELRGSLMGLFYVCLGAMQAIAPAVGGVLWEKIGLAPTFFISAALHSVGGAIVLLKVDRSTSKH